MVIKYKVWLCALLCRWIFVEHGYLLNIYRLQWNIRTYIGGQLDIIHLGEVGQT